MMIKVSTIVVNLDLRKWYLIVVSANSKTRVSSIDLSINIKICTESVTSHLGCLGRSAGVNFPLLYTGT